MKLSDLNLFPHPAGFQHRQLFDNGWGISVIPESDGIHYEVALMKHSGGRHAHLTYDSGITNDVVRYADETLVESLIDRTLKLEPWESV